MEWVILFVVSWVLFLILVDWKELKVKIWSGLLAVLLQMSVDTNAIIHQLYRIVNPVLSIWGSSLFFVFGPVFVIATLMTQYHPAKRWMRVLNVFVISMLYSVQEILLLESGALEYLNWHFIDSIVVNVSAMVIISWFIIVVLDKRGEVKK